MSHRVQSTSALVIVLLPVYNGERFLREQIDSILAQTHQNLRLVCRDDGSSDGSLQILQEYVVSHPDKVQLLQDHKGNLGASGCFSLLMFWALENCEHGYIALADQDDIWHLDKLQYCVDAMLLAEKSGTHTPFLVHSDLRVVDAECAEIAPSFMHYQGLDPARTAFASQLILNTVTGCTSLMNLALLKKALPVPPQAVMHDWWLSLVASAFGRLIYVPLPLVEYRQHGRNTLGAREYKGISLNWQTIKKLFQTRKSDETQQIYQQAAAQARTFETRFLNDLNAEKIKAIANVALLPHIGLWQQRFMYRRLVRHK